MWAGVLAPVLYAGLWLALKVTVLAATVIPFRLPGIQLSSHQSGDARACCRWHRPMVCHGAQFSPLRPPHWSCGAAGHCGRRRSRIARRVHADGLRSKRSDFEAEPHRHHAVQLRLPRIPCSHLKRFACVAAPGLAAITGGARWAIPDQLGDTLRLRLSHERPAFASCRRLHLLRPTGRPSDAMVSIPIGGASHGATPFSLSSTLRFAEECVPS